MKKKEAGKITERRAKLTMNDSGQVAKPMKTKNVILEAKLLSVSAEEGYKTSEEPSKNDSDKE
jgi:hypothetical protein